MLLGHMRFGKVGLPNSAGLAGAASYRRSFPFWWYGKVGTDELGEITPCMVGCDAQMPARVLLAIELWPQL